MKRIRTGNVIYILAIQLVLLSFWQCKGVGAAAQVKSVDSRVDSVLSLMTLEEKVGQLVLFTSHWDVTGPTLRNNEVDDIKAGKCGNIFNAHTAAYTRQLQEMAVNETRLGIPLLFGYDVIHGHKTIFPISLGESASWDMEQIENGARVAAIEAAASGLHWTFAPMVDVCREPRWGRISEGAGEDPFLGSAIARARVNGFQGTDLKDTLTVLACVKHFAAYGAPQAGRDYHSVDMSERVFREDYLPPYIAALDAGALSVMTSFNDLDGVPASGSKELMTDLLRDELGFDGFVVTDYTAINEMIPHGVAKDEYDAGLLAMKAGVDMDMQGAIYYDHLKAMVDNGDVSVEEVDQAVRRVLKLKFMLGLFDDPYRYSNEAREKRLILNEEHLNAAYEMSKRSLVLLKNENQTLPLSKGNKIAVIGPLANSKKDLLGSWKAAGEWKFATTILKSIKDNNKGGEVYFAKGCGINSDDRSGFKAAVQQAKKADQIVMVMGEAANMSGEAACRTDITLPGVQTELIEEMVALGKPVVLVFMSGRPLALEKEDQLCDAIIEAWFPGVEGGKAIGDVLFGKYNPSGKLPVTFPRNLGQVPIYHSQKNTGRPYNPSKPKDKYKSRYLDSPNDPLYPFGYGLSYTTFKYSDIQLSKSELTEGGSIKALVKVTNTGEYDGEEVVQMYIRDHVASVTPALKKLKGFKKLMIRKGETKTVEFIIDIQDLSFYRKDMTFGAEPGEFTVFIGGNSEELKSTPFKLIE